MKKFAVLFIVVFGALFLAAGCGTAETQRAGQPASATQVPEPTAASDVSEPTSTTQAAQAASDGGQLKPGKTHIAQSLGDNTSIDAEVTIPVDAEIPTADVSFKPFDDGAVKTALFNGQDTTAEQVEHAGTVVQSKNGDLHGNYWTNPRQNVLYFRTNWFEYIENIVHWGYDNFENNLARFSDTAALNFGSRADALNAVTSAVKTLGLANVANAKIYALDHETLQGLEDQMRTQEEIYRKNPKYAMKYNFKNTWGVEDDCYLITMDFVVNGIALDSRDTDTRVAEEQIAGSGLTAVYSTKGLQYLWVSNCYVINSLAKARSIISAQDAASAIGARYSKLTTGSKYIVTDLALKYVPHYSDSGHNAYRLVPAWCYTLVEKGTDSKINNPMGNIFYKRLDAYTGKEL